MKRTTVILALAAISSISAWGQGFLNLDFESAYNLPGNPGSGTLVSVTNALPGWTVDGGDISVYYASNSFSGAGTSVELKGGALALSGNFSVELFDGGSINQTGLIPDNAESLQFEAAGPEARLLSITLGGQTLSYSLLSEGTDYNVYGVNIPVPMDGQTEALTFANQQLGAGVLLDNIEFSTMSVPEPAEGAMIGLGTILLGLRFRDRQVRRLNR